MTLAALTERIKLSFFEYILDLGKYLHLSCEIPVHIVVDHNWQFSPAMHFQCNFFKGITTQQDENIYKAAIELSCYTPRFSQGAVSSDYGLWLVITLISEWLFVLLNFP